MEELIYLVGPIDSRICQGETFEDKKERFAVAQAYHEAHGRKVFNPFEFGQAVRSENPDATIESIMLLERQKIINDVTEMFLMEKWQYSQGCIDEINLAGRLWLKDTAKELGVQKRFVKFSYESYDTIMAGREHLARQRQVEHADSRSMEIVEDYLQHFSND